MFKWSTAIFMHDDSTSEDVINEFTNTIRKEVTVSIFDLAQGNVTLNTLPIWALGNMFILVKISTIILKSKPSKKLDRFSIKKNEPAFFGDVLI
jgi:hypothetical protein